MTGGSAVDPGGIARMRARVAHWLDAMEARTRSEHQAAGGTAGDDSAAATAWRPIGEAEAPRLVAALVEPKEPTGGAGHAGAVAGNARPRVALAAVALGTAISGAAWWIAGHEEPGRASLPGTGTPGSAAFARPGDTPGAIQEPEVNKQIAAAVIAGVAATGGANAQTAVQWRVQDGGNGHWYQFVSDLGDWDDGVSSAIRHGAHLATCPSAAESGFVRSVAAGRRVYLGGHQPIQNTSLEPAAGWVWVTAEPWSYANWEMNEPNNLGTTQHWLAMIETGEWDDGDIDASNVIGFIFEWSADCNNDGIVDYGQCLDGSMWDGNANNVPDCCEQGLPCTVLGRPVQWRVEDGGNGHWYRGTALPSGGYTRAAALAAARAQHGDLVSIGSSAERDFIAANAMNHPRMWVRDGGTTYGPWSGAFMDATCTWTWSDGEPFVYAPWAFGEPDSGCGWAGDSYGCFACKSCGPTPSLPTQFVDLGAGNALAPGLVVEWSADCNNDGIVDYGQILGGAFADENGNGVLDTCECAGADITANGTVDGADLGALLAFWGPVGPVLPEADLNGDGIINGEDLGILLSNWGPCGG